MEELLNNIYFLTISNLLSVYGLLCLIFKIFFKNKNNNGDKADIIDGNLSLQENHRRNQIRKKWYYKIKKWF